MPDEFTTTLVHNQDGDNAAFIRRQLYEFNLGHTIPDQHELLAVYLWDERGRLAGGLLGETFWSWLGISILWLREDVRGKGLGLRLLHEVEAEGRRRGCKHVMVDTFEYQAPEFYRKHGYTVWGVIDDLPPGHQRIHFRKDL